MTEISDVIIATGADYIIRHLAQTMSTEELEELKEQLKTAYLNGDHNAAAVLKLRNLCAVAMPIHSDYAPPRMSDRFPHNEQKEQSIVATEKNFGIPPKIQQYHHNRSQKVSRKKNKR